MFCKIRLVLMVSLFSGFAQATKGENYNRITKIEWNKPIKVNYQEVISFDKAVYNAPKTICPYYENRTQLNENDLISVSLNQAYFEPLSTDQLKAIPNLSEISDSITIHYRIEKEKKKSILVYSFIPLRKNPQTGTIEALKYFSIRTNQNQQAFSKKTENTNKIARYMSSSILATGKWTKILVSKSGVYQLTYDELISMGFSSPSQVRIFGNGGKELPEVYTDSIPDDLNEIPLEISNGSDGIFNSGDYVYFYAEGSITWALDTSNNSYTHSKNSFTDKIPYFITSATGGLSIKTHASPETSANQQSSTYDGLFCHEENINNILGSGRVWYGENFGTKDTYSFPFTINGLVTTEPIKITASLVGRSSTTSTFSFYMNSSSIGTKSANAVNMADDLAKHGNEILFSSSSYSSKSNTTVEINYDKGGISSAEGWLRYLRLIARQNTDASLGQFIFRDSHTIGSGNITQYLVSGSNSKTEVWDITNLNNAFKINTSLTDGTIIFTANSNELREYIAFDPTKDLLKPEFISENNGAVSNQNLHSAKSKDIIIVVHPLFEQQAIDLANFHLEHDGLTSLVVTPQEIYNEFSSGLPSPAAIRNFMKMFYDRAETEGSYPKYLLLFGDGSYDNRSEWTSSSNNTNYIITYESSNSLDPSNSYVSDDYFGLLDDNETITSGLLDIGIGRLPVQDTSQARVMVNKVIKYNNSASMGDWRNNICLVADDADEGDNNTFMTQTDSLAKYYIFKKLPNLNVNKIYIDAYKQVPTSTGQRYPEVNVAIRNQLNRGSLILNYTGHGGEKGLAQEQIMLQNEDIKKWNNENYPLFITATCEFSRFDNYESTSAGEDVLLNENGGGIGLLSTTRVVYSYPNFDLNLCVYNNALTRSADNPDFRLGDIMRITKNNTSNSVNKLCFTLLGDPALSLAIPKFNVLTDSINHKPIDTADTLKSYASVEISGHLEDENKKLMSDFNGVIYPTLFDKARTVTSLANDGGTPFSFKVQDNLLFRGTATVKNGYFSYNFILPRDMNYDFGNGRFSYYATNFTDDAWGSTSNGVIVGGVSDSLFKDSNGPIIKLYMNDTTFKDGGITDQNPTFLAKMIDEYGINSGGNGIGHDIVATIDDDPEQTYILNNFYQSDLDTYWKGTIKFPLSEVEAGKHTIKLKVWDIFNNSSESTLNFEVPGGNKMVIQRLYNYPNPFSDYTWFVFEHNRPEETLSAEIQIYDLAGSFIKSIPLQLNSSGYTSGPIYWNGNSTNGKKISSGIYIYRVILRSNSEKAVSKAQKLIIMK